MAKSDGQIQSFTFSRGLRQDAETLFMPANSLLSCQNVELDKAGAIQRREGSSAVTTTLYGNDVETVTPPVRGIVEAPDGQLVYFTEDMAYVYSDDSAKTAVAGTLNSRTGGLRGSVSTCWPVVSDQSGYVKFCDVASAEAPAASGHYWIIICTVQVVAAGTGKLYIQCIDRDTGARITLVSGGAACNVTVPPRIAVIGTKAFVVYALAGASTTIAYISVDLSTTPVTESTGTFVTDADGTGSNQWFDVSANTTTLVLAYRFRSGANIYAYIRAYNSSAALQWSYQWLKATAGPNWTPYPISVVINDAFGTSGIYAIAGDANDLEAVALDSSGGTAKALTQPTGAAVNQVAVAHTSATSALATWSANQYPAIVTDAQGSVKGMRLTKLAGGLGQSTICAFGGYILGSRPFTDTATGGVFSWARFTESTRTQSHFLLLDWGIGPTVTSGVGDTLRRPLPLAHVASGRVPFWADNGFCPTHNAAYVGGTRKEWLTSLLVNVGASALSGQQVVLYGVAPNDSRRYLSTGAAGLLMVGGATPLAFDGQRFVELGFYSYPCVGTGNATASNGAGTIANGTYQYRFTWEWTDAKGLRHQSPASPAVSVTLAGANDTVTWSIQNLNATRKQWDNDILYSDNAAPVKLVMYRTTASGTVFYRVGDKSLTTAGSDVGINTVDGPAAISVVDTLPDATITVNEILYEKAGGQNKLASMAPPPCYQMTVHNQRLWGLDIEQPERVWCSKTFEDGEAPGYNAALQVQIRGIGRVWGVGGQDDKLYAFGTGGTYVASYGAGPDNTGAGGFPDPVLLTTAANCTDPRATITSDDGIYWSGDGKWGSTVFLLRRGGGIPIDIGKRANAELSVYPVIGQSVLRVEKERLEFLVSTTDDGAQTSEVLYYHHAMVDDEGIGAWTQADFNGAGLWCIGSWHDRTAYGTLAANVAVGPISWQDAPASDTGLDRAKEIPWLLTTGDIRLGYQDHIGLLDYGQAQAVTLLATADVAAAFSASSVTHVGTGTSVASLTGTPVTAGTYVVTVTTSGDAATGTAKYSWAVNGATGGTNVSPPGPTALGATGVSVTFAAGSMVSGDTYTWTVSPIYTFDMYATSASWGFVDASHVDSETFDFLEPAGEHVVRRWNLPKKKLPASSVAFAFSTVDTEEGGATGPGLRLHGFAVEFTPLGGIVPVDPAKQK